MKNYSQIISGVTNTAWAIMPNKMSEIMALINSRLVDAEASAFEASANRSRVLREKTAILPLYGVISQKMNLMTHYSGGTSTDIFGQWFDEAVADSSVSRIVLDVDSPGGSVYGITELANKIYNARGKKPILAVSNSLMASAAYWIASAADQIYITKGGEAGSIGVIAVHVDQSQANEKAGLNVSYVTAGDYKAEGNSDEPLTDEARGFIQSRVNEYYDLFTGDIAKFRKKDIADVKSKFGQGRVFGANQAIRCGMADKIGSIEYVLRLPTHKVA
jgi:signal peptide peptidase SppA